MNFLHLPVDLMAVNLAGMVACVAIMVVCVCRLNVSKTLYLRVSLTQLMFIAFAFWAFGTFLDLLRGEVIGLHRASAGLGILLYLYTSYREWKAREALTVESIRRDALVTATLDAGRGKRVSGHS